MRRVTAVFVVRTCRARVSRVVSSNGKTHDGGGPFCPRMTKRGSVLSDRGQLDGALHPEGVVSVTDLPS